MHKKKIVLLSAAILFCVGIVIVVSAMFRYEDISYTEPSEEEQEGLVYVGKWNLYYDEDNRLIRRNFLPHYSYPANPEYQSEYEYDQHGNLIYFSYEDNWAEYGEEYSYKYKDGKLVELDNMKGNYDHENYILFIDDYGDDSYKRVYRVDLDEKGRIEKFAHLEGDINDEENMDLWSVKEFYYDKKGRIRQLEQTDTYPVINRNETYTNTYEYSKSGRLLKIVYESTTEYLDDDYEDEDEEWKSYAEFVYKKDEVVCYTYHEDGRLKGKCEYEYDSAGNLTGVLMYTSDEDYYIWGNFTNVYRNEYPYVFTEEKYFM